MNKVYKGYELIKAYFEDKEIKGNQLVRVTNYNGFNPEQQDKYVIDILKQLTPTEIISREFELIKDQTIDIDSIEEIDTTKTFNYTMQQVFEWNNEMEEKINQVIRAVKHLNKEIQSIKKKE